VKLIDLNILLYVVNRDSIYHRPALEWWEQALNGDEPVGLAWTVLLGFVRLATNPDIFPKPLEPKAAISKVNAWLSLENVRLVQETEDHWTTLSALLNEAGMAGNLVTDAHLAALAITHGAALASCDTDFARFKGLRWENPIRRS
jgi:toxin-antitoxin system PIN domain toxin